MTCSIIVAYSKNRVIGQNGKIPWYIPNERDRFKKLCNGKKVIMGRKTFEEIGHSLSYCTIIIVSKSIKKAPKDCLLAPSLKKAFELCKDEIIIAGGAQIYKKAIKIADYIYATEVQLFIKKSFNTVCFPKISLRKFECTESQLINYNPQYKYLTFKKK